MKPFARVGTVVLLAIIGAVTPASAQAQKPNILVIWGDDIGISNIRLQPRNDALQNA